MTLCRWERVRPGAASENPCGEGAGRGRARRGRSASVMSIFADFACRLRRPL